MKKLLLIVAISFMGLVAAKAQTTYEGSLTFHTQAEIDNFIWTTYTKIDSSVTIEETTQDDIWNFYGLSKITEIAGDLIIKNNHKLPFLSWLENLTTIGGALIVQNNTKLESFRGLSGLQTVDSVYVHDNPKLINFAGTEAGHEGLSSLTSVRKDIKIWDNDNLINFEGLSELKTVGRDMLISSNALLKSLEGLDNIKSIGGNLTISSNDNLNSLTELDNVKTIGGSLGIWENVGLVSIAGLNKVKSIGRSLNIFKNPMLKTIGGLNNIDTVGRDLDIFDNPKLESLEELINIKSVGGDLTISSNDMLESLEGLNNIKSVGGVLSIDDNDMLNSLAELDNIKKIKGFLNIGNNDVLTDISGIRNIDPATIDYPDAGYTDLYITNNPQLSLCSVSNICEVVNDASKIVVIEKNAPGCTGKPEVCTHCTTTYPGNIVFTTQTQIDTFYTYYYNCTKIEGNVIVEGNDIWNFAGLNRINTITGNLTIQNNPILPILSWLDNLTYIGGDFLVQKNNALVSFEGLNGLKTIDGYFHVWNNKKLKEFKGAGTKPALGELTTVGEELYIFNNDELTSFAGLDNVTYIGGYLDIWDNNGLVSLAGLNKVDSVGGFIYIADNDMLNSLAGLDNIKKIKGYLIIADNDVLNNISGISNIDPATIDDPVIGGTDLFITNNPKLSLCSVSNICKVVNDASKIVKIENNAPGCTGKPEVCTHCTTTYTGNIVFTTQTQIDTFYIYYYNCIRIDGNITVEGNDIWNFAGLNRITEITGDLIIQKNNKLPFLSWLENLTTIGGGLIVQENANLVSFQGLSRLQTVDSIYVYKNPALINFAGTEAGHKGLSSLTSVGKDLKILENNNLTSFEGLCELKTIGRDFNIMWNGKLIEFKGTDNNHPALVKLTSVGVNLWIYSNALLKTLEGLMNITSVRGDLWIFGNERLTSLEGLKNVESVGRDLWITSNPKLEESLKGLDKIESVGGDVSISDNKGLLSLKGLDNVKSVGRDLWIADNPKLEESLKGLDNVKSVGRNLYIGGNKGLLSLAGLNKVNFVGGYLDVFDNDRLNSLAGLDNIKKINEFIYIADNDMLNSLAGLDNIKEINGFIYIADNDMLNSLAGLDNIKKINGFIYIADNDVLNSISGIRNIDPATVKSTDANIKDLNIFNNPQLSECAMDLCPFLTYPNLTTDIHDNGNLCSDVTVMKDACTPPACTQLTDPANGTMDVKTNSNISWAAVTGAAGYWLTVGTTSGGTEILDDDMQQAITWDPPTDFDGGTTIYVTVMPYNSAHLLATCSEESFTVEAVATGVNDSEDGSGIKLYPNPAQNTLYLSYNKDAVSMPGSIRIEIYSATGQKVKVINHLTDKIDISGLNKGIYLISFITDKGTVTRKFAVAR